MKDQPLASKLEGKTIGKWKVLKKRIKTAGDNSGFWSTCYTVEDEKGNKAFLKAYNYVYAFSHRASSVDSLRFMTENYIYERDLLDFCAEFKMNRVVTAIDSGEYSESGEIIPVPYLVFEIAQGNLKSYQTIANPALEWKLKSFHHALVGLWQLHRAKIVHQDIKPSNILIFGNNVSKISDLGSATKLDKPSSWTHDWFDGDLRYAPIELLYGYCSSNWNTRRCGADLFMMGGLLTYMITDSNFLSLMVDKIPIDLRPNKFGGTFEDVKPVLLKAYYETLDELKDSIPESIRNDTLDVIAQLSHPIPEDRGIPPKFRKSPNQYSLERYISILDRICKRSTWKDYVK